MIYMGVIAFALFVGVCMIDDLFVTKEHKFVCKRGELNDYWAFSG